MKEWIKVSRSAAGPTLVTVTLAEGNLTAKYQCKANGSIKAGVAEARGEAKRYLSELKAVS